MKESYETNHPTTREKVIKLAWTSETLLESRNKGAGDKLDCTNYRAICLLNVAYKILLAKFVTLVPYANAVVQYHQAGF
jgi:hypothetical protein